MLKWRLRFVILSLGLPLVAGGFALPGCGEATPPPLDQSKFDEAKEQREVIIQKEYGQSAFDKGKKGETARGVGK